MAASRRWALAWILVATVALAAFDGTRSALVGFGELTLMPRLAVAQSNGGFFSDRLRGGERDARSNRGRGRRGGFFGRSRAELLPHRGLYVVEVSGFNTTDFVSAEGTLVIELLQSCAEWSLQERLEVTLTDAEGVGHQSFVIYRGAENSRVDRFDFAYDRSHLGKSDVFKGQVIDFDGVSLASFIHPKRADLELPANAVHPITHLRDIVAGAKGRRDQVGDIVFDGANTIPYETIAKIDPAVLPSEANPLVEEIYELMERWSPDELPTGRIWPVDLSYYPYEDQYAAPVLTRDMLLHERGITVALHLDFQDFKMDAKLARLDVLDPPVCAEEESSR